IKAEGGFVFIGFKPVGRYLFKEHIEHDKNGYLITDQYMRTSIPGVYAAGDTRAQLAKQITTAVGDATTAVLHAERYIEELKDLERAFPSEPRDVVAQTASKAELQVYAPGDIVLKEGEAADRFYMIIKGEAEATQRGPDGSQVVINRFGPGDYFGEVGLLNDPPELAHVIARSGGLEQHRDPAGARILLQAVVELEPRHPWQPNVDHHHVGRDVFCCLERRRRPRDVNGAVAGLIGDRLGDELAD